MSLALRPSWSVDLPAPSRAVIERLAARLAASPMQLRRARVPGGGGRDPGPRERDYFVLTVPDAQRRFWSPWLTIDVAPAGDGTAVHARFSPHPSVWTGFAFGYLVLGTVLAVALVIAASGTLVPGSGQGWALWLAAGVAAAMVAMWGAAQVGHRLSRAQMDELRAELETALAAVSDPVAATAAP